MFSQDKCPFYTYWIAFVACLGGFLQSYVSCIIAGALLFISAEFQLTPVQEGSAAGTILIGALAGSLCSGYLADRLGRRPTLILSAILYVATGCASFFVSTYGSLLILRAATGLALGITSILVPIYLAEIAPPSKRGAFVTAFQFFVTVGTLAAYFVNTLLINSGDWRMMFFVAAIPAAFQLIALFFFPESPKWLFGRGKISQANQVLARLQGEPFAKSEFVALPGGSPRESLFSKPFGFLIAIGIVLSAFQQFSGINAIIYFTPKIFGEAGFTSPKDAIIATLLVGVVNILSTFLTMFLIDRVGRLKLLLLSQMGVILTLLVIIISFASQSPFIDLLAVGAVIAYVFMYSLGLGPIVWVLISEIFPLAVRAKALALATVVSWTSNYLVVWTFPYFNAHLGTAQTFSIYALLSLGALAFFWRYIPETKGRSLEDLEKILVRRSD